MGGTSISPILTDFCAYRFSTVSITRTFHKLQNIQKKEVEKILSNSLEKEKPKFL